MKSFSEEVQPDVVINTSALSVPDYCETHHAEADAVNITAVKHLAECCEAGGSRFIHLSTDFVFGGDTDRPYTEEDIPAPVNYYGYTKLEGEKRIAAVCRDYAIVRVVWCTVPPCPDSMEMCSNWWQTD